MINAAFSKIIKILSLKNILKVQVKWLSFIYEKIQNTLDKIIAMTLNKYAF